MYENYLVHHGIKGMKWGVRRFQNKDGTLTEAGKRRLFNSGKNIRIDNSDRIHPDDLHKARTQLRSEAATDFRNAANIAREGANIANTTRQMARQHSENVKNRKLQRISKMDLSELTDEQLRTETSRLNLERQYRNALSDNVRVGQNHVDGLLQTVGSLLAVGVGAAGIMAAIEEMKK